MKSVPLLLFFLAWNPLVRTAPGSDQRPQTHVKRAGSPTTKTVAAPEKRPPDFVEVISHPYIELNKPETSQTGLQETTIDTVSPSTIHQSTEPAKLHADFIEVKEHEIEPQRETKESDSVGPSNNHHRSSNAGSLAPSADESSKQGSLAPSVVGQGHADSASELGEKESTTPEGVETLQPQEGQIQGTRVIFVPPQRSGSFRFASFEPFFELESRHLPLVVPDDSEQTSADKRHLLGLL